MVPMHTNLDSSDMGYCNEDDERREIKVLIYPVGGFIS